MVNRVYDRAARQWDLYVGGSQCAGLTGRRGDRKLQARRFSNVVDPAAPGIEGSRDRGIKDRFYRPRKLKKESGHRLPILMDCSRKLADGCRWC